MSHAFAVSPGTTIMTALSTTLSSSRRARPSRASTRSTTSDPTRLPTARVVVTMPNPSASSPIGPGETAYRTKIANTADEARFIVPTMIASVRSNRWPNR